MAWNESVAEYASHICVIRREYLKNIEKHAKRILYEISSEKEELSLKYKSDISDEITDIKDIKEEYKRILSADISHEISMGYSRRDEDLFRHFISGFDQKMQAQLSIMFAHNKIMEREEHRREMEQMKREITEDVLSRVSIRLEDEALKKLRDMLNDLGK